MSDEEKGRYIGRDFASMRKARTVAQQRAKGSKGSRSSRRSSESVDLNGYAKQYIALVVTEPWQSTEDNSPNMFITTRVLPSTDQSIKDRSVYSERVEPFENPAPNEVSARSDNVESGSVEHRLVSEITIYKRSTIDDVVTLSLPKEAQKAGDGENTSFQTNLLKAGLEVAVSEGVEPAPRQPLDEEEGNDGARSSPGRRVWADWQEWLDSAATMTLASVPVLQTGESLWEGLTQPERQILLGNAKKRLKRFMQGPNFGDLDDSPNANTLIMCHLDADSSGGMVAKWVNMKTGSFAVRDPQVYLLNGIKSEVVAIDEAIMHVAEAMQAANLEPIFEIEDVVPSVKAVQALYTASAYEPWLKPDPALVESEYLGDIDPKYVTDLFATPAQIVATFNFAISKRLLPPDDPAADALRKYHLSLVERKAQLLFVLRGIFVDGKSLYDPSLWNGRPWVSAFAQTGLFACVNEKRDVVRSASHLFSKALVIDTCVSLLEPGGIDFLSRLERVRARLDSPAPERRAPIVLRGDDKPTVILSSAEHGRIFGRSVPAAESASEPGFPIPVGSVVVMPDGEPAYLRGRGMSTMRDGRLLARHSRGVNATVLPFHLPDHLRDAALLLDPPPFGWAPGPEHIYFGGYRWTLRSGGGPRRFDESEYEMRMRSERMARRHVAEIATGQGCPPEDGVPPRNPFRRPDRPNYWPFPGEGALVSPQRIKHLFESIGELFHAEACVLPWLSEGPWVPGTTQVASKRSSFRNAVVVAAFPGSFDRSWESPAHERRWAQAGISPELVTRSAFCMRAGLALVPGDTDSLRDVIDAAYRDLHAQEAAGHLEREHLACLRALRKVGNARGLSDKGIEKYRQHRAKGIDASKSNMAARAKAMATVRLAYVPDPQRDGTDVIEVVPYDPNYRPEEITGEDGGKLIWNTKSPTDHDLSCGPDPAAHETGLRIYRRGAADACIEAAQGDA